MVSMSSVSAGQATHYYSEKDNYYSKEQGRWQGKGAETAGLSGEVSKEDLDKLLSGITPDGQQIQNGGQNHEHRAAIDLTFSAPKSVSILSEVLAISEVREAHEKAVSKTLEYVEENYAQARETHAGETRVVDTSNLVIGKFNHDTSRELDPQLHTHCVVLNMTQREDGQWRALEAGEIFDNKMLIGQMYRNELACNLKGLGYSITTNDKGFFEVEGIDKSLLDHFSQRSEQIAQQVQVLKESGLCPNANESKLKEIATLGSRATKKDVSPEVVREAWAERLQEQGFSEGGIQSEVQKAGEMAKTAEAERETPRLNEYDYVRLSVKAHTEQESTFSKEDILKTAGKLSIGEQRIEDLDRAFNELSMGGKRAEIQNLDRQKGVFTTKEMSVMEAGIVAQVREGNGKADQLLSYGQVREAIAGYQKEKGITLTEGQRNAAGHILSARDTVIGVQGDAGTGKTTVLDVVREELEKKGCQVRGLAHTGKAADEIERASGIRSQTIDSFLGDSSMKDVREIWMVDEASMLGSRRMSELLNKARQTEARIVFIGDTKQLQAIDAGKMFSKLQESGAMKTVEMTENIRQKDEIYKDIVRSVAERKLDSAFKKLEEKGAIHQIEDKGERLTAVTKDYLSKNPKHTLIVTPLNEDRNELNSRVREALKEDGRLQGREHVFITRESKGLNGVQQHFAQSYSIGESILVARAGQGLKAGQAGIVKDVDQQDHKLTVEFSGRDGRETKTIDLKTAGHNLSVYSKKTTRFMKDERVIFLKNDKRLHVKNGETGTIRDIDEKGSFSVKTDSGKTVDFNVRDYNFIGYAYAVTAYKSQGQTAKEVLYHAESAKGRTNYNEFYVAVTRGKDNLKIYTNDKGILQENARNEQIKTSTLDYQKESGENKINEERNREDDAAKTSYEHSKDEKSEKSEKDSSEKIHETAISKCNHFDNYEYGSSKNRTRETWRN